MQRTTRNYSKVRAARAARVLFLFFTIGPFKFLTGDVFIPTAVVDSRDPYGPCLERYRVFPETRGLFLESPATFRAHFGWHNSLCIFKTKASRGTKLCSYFYFHSLYNIWKDQLCCISRSEFYEWLFEPEKFSGLSRNGPQGPVVQSIYLPLKEDFSQNEGWR